MGVLSTYCQVCGLPVQQDHYVPQENEGYFRIWRGDGDDGFEPVVPFGAEHRWLRDAVGLRLDYSCEPVVIEGLVHDGVFEGSGSVDFVMDGIDDRAALHRACWTIAGAPDSWTALDGCEPPREQARYRQQLFDFAQFVADGYGWMLVDPQSSTPDGTRGRQRIRALLGQRN